MARPKVEINPIRGERLKQIIKEQGISQQELSKETGISQQAISAMVNGKASVTETTVKEIMKLYPQYRHEWLVGFDDFKTEGEKFARAINQMNAEGALLMRGMIAFSSLKGFSVEDTSPAFGEGETSSVEEVLKWVKDGYTIGRNGKYAQLSREDFNELENEICDYVEMRLNRIINRQNKSKEE